MRTTVSIEDNLLSATKTLASRTGKSVGEVLSQILREYFSVANQTGEKVRNGVRLLPISRPASKSGGIITNEIINRMKDEEGL